jgi:dTDP-D-glucose 4,6-dehydratase
MNTCQRFKTHLDLGMSVTYCQPRTGDLKRNYSDTSKAQEVLDCNYKIDLQKGINEIVSWFLLRINKADMRNQSVNSSLLAFRSSLSFC